MLASTIRAVLVANAEAGVQSMATMQAKNAGRGAQLYLARGGFMGMNGNYGAGILVGIAHYHPHTGYWRLPPTAIGESLQAKPATDRKR